MLCAPVFIFTSGSSALLGWPCCGLSIWLSLLAIFNTLSWVYVNLSHEKTSSNSAIFVWYENGRRRILGAQSINTESARTCSRLAIKHTVLFYISLNLKQLWTFAQGYFLRGPSHPQFTALPKALVAILSSIESANPFWVIFPNRVLSKPSIVFSSQKPFYSQPNYSCWWLGIFLFSNSNCTELKSSAFSSALAGEHVPLFFLPYYPPLSYMKILMSV